MNPPTPPHGPAGSIGETELRLALAGHAAAVQPIGDPARLAAGMRHADRMRTLRTGLVAAAVCVIAGFGVLATQGAETATPIDVVGVPDGGDPSPPAFEPQPLLDPLVEEADPADEHETVADPVEPMAPSADPSHLATPTTTAAPAQISTTTTAPPVTTAPPTTAPSTTAGPTTTAPTTTAPIEFWAQARYGTCEEDPPYDEYSGTAAPGATISITSAWNAPAQVSADGNGDWFLRVEFPDAPVGVHYDVTVTDGSESAVFDFVRTA